MKETLKIFNLNDEQRNQLLQELGSLFKQQVTLKQSLKKQENKANSEKEELLLELLEIFDALEFILHYMMENSELSPQFVKRLPKTITSVQKKLLNILQQRQVDIINCQETRPDFSLCQVVDYEIRNDLEEQTITKVVRQGFKIGDNILRPVEVIISKSS